MTGRLRSEFTDADASPGLMMWRVTNAWQSELRAALAPLGLTHMQFVLLASLVWLEGDEPTTQRHLAEHVGADQMMTSQVLRALEAKGLVRRRAHPNDARARALEATPRGVDLANEANSVVEAADRSFFARLGGEREAFTALLGRLADDRGR